MAATATYAYKGKDAEGKVVKGRIDAATESAVTNRLKMMGISPTSIQETSGGTGLQMEINLGAIGNRVKLKDLAVMTRQMSTMITSGLSLLRSLTIITEQTASKELKRILASVSREVESGSSLSDALATHSRVFPPIMISLVRAGETGGFLDNALLSVAKNFENEVKLRQTIKSAMTYPVIVFFMAILAVVAMLVFIVPIFKKMFEGFGGELPLPTMVLVWLSSIMWWLLPLLTVIVVVFSIWWNKNKNTERVRKAVDPWKLKIPVFGNLFKKIAIARFSRNFAAMMAAGVPILQALKIVGETSGNWVIEDALRDVAESVRQGRTVAEPLANKPVFPSMVTQMISVGEDAGAMEQMLEKIADFYDDEVSAATEQLTASIEPLMIAFLGLVVGGMIVALYLPIFNIFTLLNK
ncbi:MAG: type II secretion system F family protein [Homoserinimonas sp.]|nr:type II secretion system F family protein [Homoserinimonas sp.]MCW5945114.1 type II secretion system F family protein [Cryobacterium sp.]